MKDFLFPRYADTHAASLILLALRLIFGLLLLRHGIEKIEAFPELRHSFPNPLGLGHTFSLVLAICAEAVCAAAIIGGCLVRLTTLPVIFSLGVAFFAVHHGSLAQGELAFVYLATFCLLFFTGAGRYSVDYLIRYRLEHCGEAAQDDIL